MSAQPNFVNMSTPHAAEGVATSIFTSATLASSGDWTRSDIISVEGAREIALLVTYNATSGAGGYPQIVPLVASTWTQPAAGDDSWYGLATSDGTITAVTLDTGLPAGADYTAAPEWGSMLQYPLVCALNAADNASDKFRIAIRLNVAPYRWFHFIAAEKGLTANPGTLSVSYVLTSG